MGIFLDRGEEEGGGAINLRPYIGRKIKVGNKACSVGSGEKRKEKKRKYIYIYI